MPFRYRIDRQRERILVVADGVVDFDACIALADRIPQDPDYDARFEVLCDLRRMDFLPEVAELQAFARSLVRFRQFFTGRIAVIAQPGVRFGMARMTCILADVNGFKMEAFASEDRATAWLADGRESVPPSARRPAAS